MLDMKLIDKIETLTADKGYDDVKIINFLNEKNIKSVIDIRNLWKDGEPTKQYKNTDIVYTYRGEVGKINDNGEFEKLKYLGYDKIKDTLRYSDEKKYIVQKQAMIEEYSQRQQEIVKNGKDTITKEQHQKE